MEPALYPLYGILYVLLHPDVLVRIIGLVLLELLVPIYWVSDWLVDRHHSQIFQIVLSQQVAATKPVGPLDGEEREKLLRQAEVERSKRANRSLPNLSALSVPSDLHPVLKWLVWIFTPPSSNMPFLQYYGKKLVNAPVKLLLPGGRYIFGIRDTATLGLMAMTPYLKKKGIDKGQLRDAVGLVQRWRLRRFGMCAYVLSAIPILSWLFAFTNYVGAALWAADFERGDFWLVRA
eukprot:jgi/Botrbrau1/8808/Bobra.0330s0038.1